MAGYTWPVAYTYAVLFYNSFIKGAMGHDEMLDSTTRNLMNVAESERFRVGRVAARRLRDPELLEPAKARMAHAPPPPTPRTGQARAVGLRPVRQH